MYGLVVAATLLTTSATPAWGCHGCNGGCYGCWGYSCHGGFSCHGAFSCYGSGSCHGCWSCWGGCTGYGGGCSGCWGSCTGCGGGGMWGNWYAGSSSGSCTGGWGSCTGCYGCYGGGCYGCYGGWPVANAYVPAPVVEVNAAPSPPPATQPETTLKASPDRATLVVRLPADADLYVNGVRADLGSNQRVLVSPPLKSGRDYSYTLKTKTIHNGHASTQSRSVTVRAGSLIRVNFADPSQPAPAELDVRLPADTRLYVNNVLIPEASTHKSLETPPLDPGKKYHYVLRAEQSRAGHSTSDTRQVTVQAGQHVEVRFDAVRSVKTARK